MPIKMHKSVTIDRVMEGAESQMFGLENPGICIACGDDADGCEPDARKYRCESCEERAVYGCEELLLMIA
jgi:hypothetical protein